MLLALVSVVGQGQTTVKGHVVGKERRYPICPAIRVKGYEVAK